MEYILIHHQDGAGFAPAFDLSQAAQRLLQRLLGLPDGSLVEFNQELAFGELESAGHLRLVTNRRRHDGEVFISSRTCHVSPSPSWSLEAEINPELFIGLPFVLSQTRAASDWLAELDYVDPYTGDLEEVWQLARSAPSMSAGHWMGGLAKIRQAGLSLGYPPVPMIDEVEANFSQRLDHCQLGEMSADELEGLASSCPTSMPHVIVMLNGLAGSKRECQQAKGGMGKIEVAVLDGWQGEVEEAFRDYLWSLTLAAPWSQQARQTLRMYLAQAPLSSVGVTIQKVLDLTSPTSRPSGCGRGPSM